MAALAAVVVAHAPFPMLAAQSIAVRAPRSTILTNYNRLPIGQREGIEAGAFVARTNDAGAAWYNPAGLARSEGNVFNASANAYEWTRLTLAGLGDTTGRAQLSGISTFVGAVIARPIVPSDRWRVGLSITTPVSWNPGGIDVAFTPASATTNELFRYASNDDFKTEVWGLSVGYAPRGVGKSKLRLGAGLAIANTNLAQDLTVSDRRTTSTSADTRLRSYTSDGSINNLLASAGVQWDVNRRATVGLRLVSSGIRLTSSGMLVLEGSNFAGGFSEDLTFRDEAARFEYKVPVEIDAGFTWRYSRGAIEADVRYYGSIARYALYESDVLATLTSVSGDEPPVITSIPFTSTFTAARSVTNVAIGGNYRLTSELRLHAGFTSDVSPIGSPTESVFVSTDLYRLTSGLTFAWTSLAGSVGIAYGWGAGEPRPLGDVTTGTPAETRLEVRTINLVYAFSYAFGGRATQ